jgi:hypothetical protein
MSDTQRIQSFSEFWLYYIGEHRNPLCRVLHFIGTGTFIGVLVWSLVMSPVRMGTCFAAGLLVAFLARHIESERMAGPEALSIVILWVVGSPLVAGGIFVAYLFAWIGHFKVEHNRPATFQYPLWSLFGDFRMVGTMLTGRLWSGDPVVAS